MEVYFFGYPGWVQWTKVKGKASTLTGDAWNAGIHLYLTGKCICRVGGSYSAYLACIIILCFIFGKVDQGLFETVRICDKLEELANAVLQKPNSQLFQP